MLKRLLIAMTTLGVVALLIQSFPDIKRYLEIRKMVLRGSPVAPAGRGERAAPPGTAR
ncbi:DUF6893 family small protein [Planotetraspora sp. GP83]|uniref:DUF6893 family small protein n=1 Tax=Planotetraspora sp. GP83 TaxID=3156264 RepID=UPI003515F168